jgi:hypothetical protein
MEEVLILPDHHAAALDAKGRMVIQTGNPLILAGQSIHWYS